MRLFLVVVLTACNASTPPAAQAEVDDTLRRIVVMAPAAAEILTRLGVADRIVGVGPYVSLHGNMTQLPVVGAFDGPNVEIIVSLKADALITSVSSAALPGQDRLRALGVKIIAVDTSTLTGLLAAVRALGDQFQRGPEAAQIIDDLQAGLAGLHQQAQGHTRRRVLFVVGQKPWYAAGAHSHVDAMIDTVGGVNVLGDSQTPYLQISLETALASLPEVIIDCSDNSSRAHRGRVLGFWAKFPFVPAVATRRVYAVHPDRLLVPGPRLVEMTRFLGQMVYPEIFGEPHDEP